MSDNLFVNSPDPGVIFQGKNFSDLRECVCFFVTASTPADAVRRLVAAFSHLNGMETETFKDVFKPNSGKYGINVYMK